MVDDKMHDDEVDIDSKLVRRLLTNQFPKWSRLPLAPVLSAGTDNALYRLGDDLCVRLPRIDWAAGQAQKEMRWLPFLAPHLPLEIPVPRAVGEPEDDYPWHWGVYEWLDGHNATIDRLTDKQQAAIDMAEFIRAMWTIDTTDGPRAEANSARGVPLALREDMTRAAIFSCQGMIDTHAVNAAWKTALDAPAWDAEPVWLHGDIQSGNLLAQDGELTAVIDFGAMGIGDPACDLMVAWNLFTAPMRWTFRQAIDVDDATWVRGRGWALSVALVALPYYRTTNPVLADISRYAIDQVLADVERERG
ncbi:MAG: aminoglycoside phosphotransferase family protein [Anaerolineaceae bacterium]|nr:aminoglycoside phosphotransferase family protein [Anaerolineaceae bacterium]